MWGIHRSPVNSPHKGQYRGKCFHLMTSSCVKRHSIVFSRLVIVWAEMLRSRALKPRDSSRESLRGHITTMHFNKNASVPSIITTCIGVFALKSSIQRTGFQRYMYINSKTRFRRFETLLCEILRKEVLLDIETHRWALSWISFINNSARIIKLLINLLS